MNQLKSVVQTASPNPQNTTQYSYDTNGNLTNLTDANSHLTQNGFDVLNRLKTETLPAGPPTQTRTYDSAGNLISLTDYNGKTTTYTYDTLNRLSCRTPDASLTDVPECFTYTATGKRATMTDASGATTYTYDNQDRLITKATPQGTLAYTYDTAGNVASMASSNLHGISVAYTYDNLNRLSTVVDNQLPVNQNTTRYSYDPASNLATVTYPNGLSSSFTYDDLNRLKSMNGYTYQLSATGNRTSASEPSGRAVNWTYDGIYRLTQETITLDPHANNGTVSYGLDSVGNRLSQTSSIPGIPSGTFAYDANDQLSSETYDNNGNTLVSGARTFAYDFENRLKSMTANGTQLTMVYDGDSNRVAKAVGTVTTRYLVDDLNPTGFPQVIEELVGGSTQRTYTYGLQRINQNQQTNGSWTPGFYGYDGFGSARLLTDATGAVTNTYSYDAWGNSVESTGTTPNVYLYRGEQYDPDLQLYYLRARYFNPLSGRFLSHDPFAGDLASPASLHKYLYSGADPVNGSDPSGRLATKTLLLVVPAAVTVGTLVTIGVNIQCIWGTAGSWLKLANWVDHLAPGATPYGLKRLACGVSAEVQQERTDDLIDTVSTPSSDPLTQSGRDRRPRGKCPAGEDHHLLPYELREWFGEKARADKRCNIESPNLHACCPSDIHDEIHGESWNRWWRDFRNRHEGATCSQILEYLDQLVNGLFSGMYKQCTPLPGVRAIGMNAQ